MNARRRVGHDWLLSAPDCAQLSAEVVSVGLHPLLDKATVVGIAEDVDQFPLHVLAIRLDSADGCVGEFLVEAAGPHGARAYEVAVDEDLRSSDREVGEARP